MSECEMVNQEIKVMAKILIEKAVSLAEDSGMMIMDTKFDRNNPHHIYFAIVAWTARESLRGNGVKI